MAENKTIYFGEAGPVETINYQWWSLPEKEVYTSVIPYLKTLEQGQAYRRLQFIQFARLYQNQDPVGNLSANRLDNNITNPSNYWASYNVVRSCIDTATSKIAKAKPRPVFLTEGGDYAQQNRAKKLTQYLDGAFDQMKIYTKGAQVFRDGGIFGIGAMKFWFDKECGEVQCERVLIDEIMVDDSEALYGKPRQMHHRTYVSRTALAAKYPKHKAAIMAAPRALPDLPTQSTTPDLIRVIESWHLPTSKENEDGLKTLCIEGATLECIEYTKSYFPFVFWRWDNRVSGFWGLGLAEELFGTQLEINKLLRNVQLAQHLVAVPRVFIQNGSLVSSKLDNNIGAVIKYSGAIPPTFHTPQAMSGEIYNHIRWLVSSSYERTGISQMSATSQKPAGLDSGVAIREYHDIESERFMVVGQRWEEFYLECAKITIDLTRDLYEAGAKPKTKVAGKEFMDTVDWKSVSMPEDQYVLRCFAASILPTTPAGRLQKIQELYQAGFIPKEWAAKLLDFPDLKDFTNAVQASNDLAQKMIDKILEDGEWVSPEPQMNLQEALTLAQLRYILAKLNNVPEENCSLLQRWMEQIKSMLPAKPQIVDPMQQMPLAQPEAQPTSDLMPLTPGASNV